MDAKTFLEDFIDILDTEDEVTLDTTLADIEEWDSLSRIATLAYATGHGRPDITPDAIRSAVTVQDLYNIFG